MAQVSLDPSAMSALCVGDDLSKCVGTALASKKKTPKPPTTPTAPSTPTPTQPKLQSWMSTDLSAAWAAGYKGKGVTVTFIDDFSSSSKFSGNFGLGVQTQRHGEWTREETSLLAPEATIVSKDFNTTSNKAVTLYSGLNVLNLSYGMYANSGYGVNQIGWAAEEKSIITAAGGQAVVAKAAGNDAVAVGGVTNGKQDYLDLALIGKQSVIFVGALDTNGTVNSPTQLSYYSNYAGSDPTVQSHFLVVGVDGSKTGLLGTSFAAPVIAGYAAIIGSKFKSATATAITNDLLSTARTDTLINYSASTYGMGEASLSRALAPASIK